MHNKLKQLTRIGILCLGIIFTITNCSKDELTTIELTETQKIKELFSLENFDNPFVKNNLEINWNKFKLNTDDKNATKPTYEFNTILNANDFIENGETTLFFKYTLQVSKIRENQWNFEIIKFITEDNIALEKASSFLSEDFSGTMAYFNLNGELTEIKGLEKGLKISPPTTHNTLARIPLPTDHDPSDGGGGSSGGGSFQWIEVVHYTDWYKVYSNGTQEYTHTEYNYSTWEYVYVPADGNYSNNSPYFNRESNEYIRVNRNRVDEVDEDKPDPKSFCFKTKGLWQEAATVGMKFWINLVTVSPRGIKTEYKHLIHFPQPVLFGMPSNLKIGNIDISNELAAEVTSNAINNVMKQTSRKFALKEVSTMTVEQYFRSELIRQFALHIPGGRVQFNAMNFSGNPCIFKHL